MEGGWESHGIFKGDDMLKESRVVVLVEGSGGRGNGELSRGQIMRDLPCHTEKFKLYPVSRV